MTNHTNSLLPFFNILTLAVILLAGSVVGDADAATLVSLNPDADAWVQSGSSAGSNFGSSPELQIKNENAGATGNSSRKGYIRYDLSSSLAGVISGAQFEISLLDPVSTLGTNDNNLNWNFRLYGLNDGIGENWIENGITWNNAPGNDTGSGNGANGDATLLGNLTPTIAGRGSNGQTLSLMGAALDNFLNNDMDDLVTFIVTRDEPQPNGNNTVVHIFESRTGTTSAAFPTLSFEVAPVPEPTSFAIWTLLALGLVGFGFYRVRRKK